MDEPNQLQHLRVQAKSFFLALNLLKYAPATIANSPDISNYLFSYHGVSAQYPLLVLDFFPRLLVQTQPLFWELRHLYIRGLFILAGFCLYLIIKRVTHSNFVILIGLMLFLLHPRVSADSFYNIKDSIFLSTFVITTYFLFKFIHTPSTKNIIVLGIMSAITVNVRMMGVLIPVYFLLYSILNYNRNFREIFKTLFIYLSVFSLTLYLLWPSIWGNPFNIFINNFNLFSRYTTWAGFVLFNGSLISAQKLPLNYIPTWIFITSPLAHIFLWCLGLLVFPLKLIRNFKREWLGSPILFSYYCIVVSYVAIIIFKSTLYDSWRHLQYIFPSLIIIGIYGIEVIRTKYKILFYTLSILILVSLTLSIR